MFTKTAIALAIIVTTASGALAQTKRTISPANDVFSNGTYLGSDPSANVRSMLRHDQGVD
jgi:hypothetical protein